MDPNTGNIYGPDDPRPEGVELTEIEKDQYDSLVAFRKKDVEEAGRRIDQRKANPGR